MARDEYSGIDDESYAMGRADGYGEALAAFWMLYEGAKLRGSIDVRTLKSGCETVKKTHERLLKELEPSDG